MRALSAIAATVVLALPAVALAGPARQASLTDLEQQVMCVTCGVPLAIAQSPQAERERAYIRGLISRGESTTQIKRDLVSQFGPNVLALPRSSGFNLAVYLVPVALVIALLGALALGLPRWRRRGGPPSAPPPLSNRDSERLNADLARYNL